MGIAERMPPLGGSLRCNGGDLFVSCWLRALPNEEALLKEDSNAGGYRAYCTMGEAPISPRFVRSAESIMAGNVDSMESPADGCPRRPRSSQGCASEVEPVNEDHESMDSMGRDSFEKADAGTRGRSLILPTGEEARLTSFEFLF